MAINYNNDIIVTKNSSKKAMECLENFVIKVNVMFLVQWLRQSI